MPYNIVGAKKGGYYVITQETGRKHSKKPLTKTTAEKQMKALYYALKKGGK